MPHGSTPRQELRQALLARRRAWAPSDAARDAEQRLGQHLLDLVVQLEPDVLGLYWPIRFEFNPLLCLSASALKKTARALPYAQRQPPLMHYRRWDGNPPDQRDECGVPTCAGSVVTPDVIVVPCVGFNAQGLRLGYGGGYFDRWLQAHPGVTAVGVAWSQTRCEFAAEDHDMPMDVIVTEEGIAGA